MCNEFANCITCIYDKKNYIVCTRRLRWIRSGVNAMISAKSFYGKYIYFFFFENLLPNTNIRARLLLDIIERVVHRAYELRAKE